MNLVKEGTLVYSNNKILFDKQIYDRKADKWEATSLEDEQYEALGFIPYNYYHDKVVSLQNEILSIKNESRQKSNKPKYRSLKNFNAQEKRIRKVMADVKKMRMLQPNKRIDNEVIQKIEWIDDVEERQNKLKLLYNESINKKYAKSKIYSFYKRLSVWKKIYEEKFPTKENEYSQFSQELNVTLDSESSQQKLVQSEKVTKLVKKIEIFTKFFEHLPAGSWAVCEIPLTYWLLIYRDCWEIIINCVKNDENFPYADFLNNSMINSFNNLTLSKEKFVDDDDDDDEVDDEESEEEQ